MRKILVLLLPLLVAVNLNAQNTSKKPNVIVFMADDMGYADTGFTGAKDILTPNLDALAANGVIFKQGYTNHAFCGPSRAALMSGRYPYRFGFETNPAYDPANPHMGIDTKEKLFPERMQEVGYTTGVVGKWHLGAAQEFHPNNRGFDYFYGFLGGGHDYFRIDLTKKVWEAYLQGLVRNKKPASFDGYLTTALSKDAAKFVSDNKDEPFFLYVAYNAPHQPLQAPKEDIERYSHIKDKKRRVYAAMVDVMDRGIGEVVQSLKDNGIYENTLIFFLSDNGGPQASPKSPGKGNGSSNKPFRGGKGNMYDGGVHVPFIACWPNRIKAGTVYDYPVNSLDISRTAVEVAGGDAFKTTKMEGVNLIPFVTGENKEAPHDYMYWRGGSKWSVLASDGTKHVKETKNPELYYLPDDVSEANNILSKKSKLAKKMYSKWVEWNENNIPCVLLGYKDYHKKRDAFYEQAIPPKAKTYKNK
ncbi:sulfatase-like hydrolase/transferase [Seonamhaeicola marinus]|uniref:Sulfatase-like hydrolase/transferase n=1 Tax=Seonamhaeicola marinus TaxID=1912246 RepID=A0A5D0HTK5_9FLAO|nr:sulfatase-like hydrolase/transferase [Seonamhaeicola marinus]TYA74645.1 sulfatase-like hydrolase/transferase [Seonamhaeicola marinus]